MLVYVQVELDWSKHSISSHFSFAFCFIWCQYIPNMVIETTEAPPTWYLKLVFATYRKIAALNVAALKGQRPKQFLSEDKLNWDPVLDK